MVGYTLRQERERQNLTIEDIEQGTSIRATYIDAIENGEYDKLPGTVYAKGFIKNYAKFLGMDSDAMTKEFTSDLAEIEAEKAAVTAEEINSEKKIEQVPEKKTEPERKSIGYSIQDDNRGSSSKIIVAAVVLIAAVAGALWSWLSSPENDVATVNQPVKQEQIAQTEPQPVEPTPIANANPVPQPKSDKVEVQARFNDRCWLLVTIDGAVVQEGVVEGGQTLTWEGKNDINFRLGNAGAVEFFQDGKSLGVLGNVGDVVDKTFTKQ